MGLTSRFVNNELQGDLAEAEDGKKALEKVIHEAKERAKSQEKTLRAQEVSVM